MYDSGRDYLEQLAHYQEHKGGEDTLAGRTRTCDECGREFTAARADTRLCSKPCRYKAWVRRAGGRDKAAQARASAAYRQRKREAAWKRKPR